MVKKLTQQSTKPSKKSLDKVATDKPVTRVTTRKYSSNRKSSTDNHASHLNDDITLILQARHYNPFGVLGLHGAQYCVFMPYADSVRVQHDKQWLNLDKVHTDGLFKLSEEHTLQAPCLLEITRGQHCYQSYDPYTFESNITRDELYLFGEGNLRQAYKMLGAHFFTIKGVEGVRFAVWAPNAERVSVIGNFNHWDGRVHPMRFHGNSGVWDIFIPHLSTHDLYKFEIRNRDTGQIHVKTDPYGFAFEPRPGTAARITRSQYTWQDQAWLDARMRHDWLHAPFNCYEVHLGSWRRHAHGQLLSYRALAETLVPYVVEMGYTHVELLPITEHPLTESWGYQTTGYFGVTHRYGSPDDLRFLIDSFHQAGIGVLLDWVPGHFPKDDWALARFDGTALYEHEDPRLVNIKIGAHTFSIMGAMRCVIFCLPMRIFGFQSFILMVCVLMRSPLCYIWITRVHKMRGYPTGLAGVKI